MPRFLSGRFALAKRATPAYRDASRATIVRCATRPHQALDAWNELAGHAHCLTIARRNGIFLGGSTRASMARLSGFRSWDNGPSVGTTVDGMRRQGVSIKITIIHAG